MTSFFIISSLSLILLTGYFFIIRAYHVHLRNPEAEAEVSDAALPFVSVIIPARNESLHIADCIQSVINQKYPRGLIEIIVVDDHSSDQTAVIAEQTGAKVLHLQDAGLSPNTVAYKKAALQYGIVQSKGELILTTDADCIAKPQWIHTMVQCLLHQKVVMVSGPVLMQSGLSFFEKFQSLDYSILQGITSAANAGGIHDLSSGANMCYVKNAFIDAGGYNHIDHIASGDDMLLQQKFRKKFPGKIYHCWNQNAIVATRPEKTFRSFLQQRIRWSSKTSAYQDSKIKWILAWVYLFNVSLITLTVCSLFSFQYFMVLCSILFLKILVEWRFVKNILNFFGNSHLIKSFIAFQPLHIFYVVVSGFLGLTGKYQWKGRTVR